MLAQTYPPARVTTRLRDMIRLGIRKASSEGDVSRLTEGIWMNTLGNHSTQRYADDMQTALFCPLEVIKEAEEIQRHPAAPMCESIPRTEKIRCAHE